MCLFWGADLWLQPSRQMLTVQNPKKSWLAMKPAFSLVEDAVSGAAIQARVLEWGAIAFSVAAAAAKTYIRGDALFGNLNHPLLNAAL